MADYFIGDLQGCFAGFQEALATVGFHHGRDNLWLTGDLIARGEDSLATLDYIYQHQNSIQFVLGNHDLHFLALANGLKKPNKKDNLAPLLSSQKCTLFVDFLRAQSLLLELPDKSGFMTHAGLPPEWTPNDAVYWSQQIGQQLTHKDYPSLLEKMYTNEPSKFSEAQTHLEKTIYAINGLTRMRYCEADGRLNFSEKSALHQHNLDNAVNNTLMPWFNFQPERLTGINWVFGHWAALMGETARENIIGLDTGYVWGNHLTVLNWQSKESIQIPSKL